MGNSQWCCDYTPRPKVVGQRRRSLDAAGSNAGRENVVGCGDTLNAHPKDATPCLETNGYFEKWPDWDPPDRSVPVAGFGSSGGCELEWEVFEHVDIPGLYVFAVIDEQQLKLIGTDSKCENRVCGVYAGFMPPQLTTQSVSTAWHLKQRCDQSRAVQTKIPEGCHQLDRIRFESAEPAQWDPAGEYNIQGQWEPVSLQFDVPTVYGAHFQLTALPPTDVLVLDFEGIYDSHFIGVNKIELKGPSGEIIPWVCVKADDKHPNETNLRWPMLVTGWWSPVGDKHCLVLSLYGICRVAELVLWCANTAATPRKLRIRNSPEPVPIPMWSTDCCFQLNGKPASATDLLFELAGHDACSADEVVERLNQDDSLFSNGWRSLVCTSGKHLFVFYQRGNRQAAFDYFISKQRPFIPHQTGAAGPGGSWLFQAAKPVQIDKVEERALRLSELLVMRDLIVSQCVAQGWRHFKTNSALTPEEVNLYDLTKYAIVPLTRQAGCSLKELFGSAPCEPQIYVSHWWGERVLDFVACCEKYAALKGLDDPAFWYCNRQSDLESELGSCPDQSSFRKAMSLAKETLVVMDPQGIVLSRIWVDFEIFRNEFEKRLEFGTFQAGRAHVLTASALPNESPFQKAQRELEFPAELLATGLRSLLQHGQASKKIDRIRILNAMINNPCEHSDDTAVLQRLQTKSPTDLYERDLRWYQKANRLLHARYALKAWPIALASGTVGDFHGFDLAHVVRQCGDLKAINLDFTASPLMTDNEICRLSDGISPQLQQLYLTLSSCKQVTDAGLVMLLLPSDLTEVTMGINNLSENITPAAWVVFLNQFPRNTKTVELDLTTARRGDGKLLSECGDEVLFALAKCFSESTNLTKLILRGLASFPKTTDAGGCLVQPF